MIARGGVFAELRSRMLSAIPEGVQAPFRAEATLGDWIETGAFTVRACSKRHVDIEASHVDFASTILLEVENLTNHCFEHIQEIVCFCGDERPRSDAWAAVTAYYLGFFSAATLLRLIGMPVAFVNRQQLLALRTLAGSVQSPGQGAFSIELGHPLSATHRDIRLSPTGKIHESTWKTVLQLLNQLNHDPNIAKHPDEVDFYDSICTSAFCTPGIGFAWPSHVRVRANYRPGHAYKLRLHNVGVVRTINFWRDAEAADVFGVVRSAHRRCSADVSLPSNHICMMINVAISLFLLVRGLYEELILRRTIDRRWEKLRCQYRDSLSVAADEFKAITACY